MTVVETELHATKELVKQERLKEPVYKKEICRLKKEVSRLEQRLAAAQQRERDVIEVEWKARADQKQSDAERDEIGEDREEKPVDLL